MGEDVVEGRLHLGKKRRDVLAGKGRIEEGKARGIELPLTLPRQGVSLLRFEW